MSPRLNEWQRLLPTGKETNYTLRAQTENEGIDRREWAQELSENIHTVKERGLYALATCLSDKVEVVGQTASHALPCALGLTEPAPA